MLNCIVLQGRFTDDPEIRYTSSNTAVCSVSIAVQRSRKYSDGSYPTDFVPCVFWGKTAEHVKNWFHKGELAIVRGRLESRDWEDKHGNKRRSWEVQAESIDFCGNSDGQKNKATGAKPESDFEEVADDDSDVPF